jgi:hypothetical protein
MSLGNTDSTGAATTGPTTFSDPGLSWSDASSASDPSSETAAADSASADATVPPAASETPEGTPQQGEPPQERWPDILSNQRKAAAEEALKSWKAQYGWAEQINQEQFQRLQEFYQGFNDPGGDPIALLQQLIDRVSTHPEHGAKLRSLAARQLAAARGQQQAPADEMPQADVAITDANGNVVGHTYSAEAQAKREALLKQQWLSEIRKELEPVTQTVNQVKAQRAKEASDSFASTTFEELSSQLPEFKTHAKEIGQRLAALDLQTDDPAMLKLALKAIYADVVTPKREQQLTSTAQSKLLDNLQQKAAASTSVNPGSAAPSTSRTVTSFHQLGAEAWR